ncbi:hypothetical protein MMC07_001142 [Pseudocyphellaria aurata]|nr:hypothetical protein [Pseudocyphellaria aurata]
MASENMDIDGYPMKTLSSKTTEVQYQDPESRGESKTYRDEVELAHFGKRQQLKVGHPHNPGRDQNLETISLMVSCEYRVQVARTDFDVDGHPSAFASGLNNGGASGLLYGYLLAWAGTALQVLILAELGSMIPLSGGHYNWYATIRDVVQAPAHGSYLTGWISVIAWQAAMASGAFLAGTIIQGLLVLNYPSYEPQRWHGTLLFYAIATFGLFVNTYLVRLLPRIESSFLVIHILGFFGILIPLVYLAPHGTPKDVFATFNNGGGWSSTGLSFFVGLTTSLYSFIGIDAATHMAEEIENATTIIPHSMIASLVVNGCLGLGMLIGILFCLGDLDSALVTPTGFPFIEIFTQATYSKSGGTLMSSLIIAAIIFGVIGCLATSSRMTWAFARERGLPGSAHLARIDTRTALPLWSIGLTVTVNLMLALINIGSSTAFNAFTSLVVASFHSSFLVSASVLLHKRLTTPAAAMRWGPFRLGRLGIPINALAIAYGLVAVFFSFWPPSAVVTAVTMNWSIAVYGGVLLFSIFFWFLHGRKVYTGPVIEVHTE